MALGGTFHVVTLVTDYIFTVRPAIWLFLLRFHLFSLSWSALFWWLLRARKTQSLRWLVVSAQFSTITCYAYLLNWVSVIEPELSVAHMKVWTAFVVISIFSMVLCPAHNYFAFFYSLVLIPLSWWACSRIPGGSGMTYVSFLAFLGAQLFQRASVANVYEEARREYANRQSLTQAQKEIYEQQLIIARGIHDSFAAPDEFSMPGLEVKFFQFRSDAVGGDWMAMRQDDKDRLIIVVADASGKGVQAALVTHAIQAIWADSLSDVTFEPREWLSKLNKTLKLMGEKHIHSATVAIMVISKNGIEYWSAGHVPAFVIVGPEDSDIKPLVARGPLLGLEETDAFNSAIFKFNDAPFHVVLGSDGIFTKGTSSSPRDIRKIFHDANTNPAALGEATYQVDDDRSLVVVQIDRLKMTHAS